MLLGIDEAGRGAVMGPLVLAGLLIEEGTEEELRSMGVRDSKELSPRRREDLESLIKPKARDFMVLSIPADEIDALRSTKNLNVIEMERMAEIINALKPSGAIIDCPEVDTKRFKANLENKLQTTCDLICENYADKNHPVVGGASILAKVVRDRSMRTLAEKVGETIGSGYPSDPLTMDFLKKLAKKGDYPAYVRKSWLTAIRLKEKKQGNLNDFF